MLREPSQKRVLSRDMAEGTGGALRIHIAADCWSKNRMGKVDMALRTSVASPEYHSPSVLSHRPEKRTQKER